MEMKVNNILFFCYADKDKYIKKSQTSENGSKQVWTFSNSIFKNNI